MGDRVIHRAGNAVTEDLGSEAWDVVFVAQLLHHFDEPTNRDLARRVARALRPGGVFVVQDMIRPTSPQKAGQIGALLDLYFAATSEGGTWAVEEIATWQRDAGLAPRRPTWLRSLPGSAQQVAVKPADPVLGRSVPFAGTAVRARRFIYHRRRRLRPGGDGRAW